MTRIFSLAFLIWLLASGASWAQTPGETALVLRPGDAIRVTVWRNPELSGEFAIQENGTLAHPLLRDVVVTGVPLATVEGRVRERLARLESNPQFVIEPLVRITVGGEVRQPGLLRLPPGTTLSEAVALAGGVTERGRLSRVRLVRGSVVERVDLATPSAGWAQRGIHSGDQIFVERRTSVFRDYIAPAASVTSAALSLLHFFTR
jgi:polysaccharide export outer membrane protein